MKRPGSLIYLPSGTKLFKYTVKSSAVSDYKELEVPAYLLVMENCKNNNLYRVSYANDAWYVKKADAFEVSNE